MKNTHNFYSRVYDIVRKIPVRKVATYGQIAEILGTRDARKIGWLRKELTSSRGLRPRSRRVFIRGKAFGMARYVGFALHANKNPEIPCHRVVNKDGRVATNYAFGGGWKEQKLRLLAEGVAFIDEKQVDLDKHVWTVLAK